MNKEKLFEEAYSANRQILFKIAYRITGNSEVSEELCQEAFIRYYERIENLPKGDESLYWLIRVVKNLSLNYEKRKNRESNANRRFHFEEKTSGKSAVNDGEKAVIAEESKDMVQEALKKIPPHLRLVLVLKEYASLNYKEIGKIMKITEGNVKIRVFRAREQLHKILAKEDVHVS